MADSYTELEKAVVVLVENFYKYVSKHSLAKDKISKSSFRKMLQKELNHMLMFLARTPGTEGLLISSSRTWTPTTTGASASTSTGS
ncbi:protein S100-A16 isoform X2 [Tursiops truncatus]|uniref:Protein S100-A16 isoform X2 n=1 Tax=Tursiops truncatus TaxID=9739 RepID=A0A6J3RKV7_TURTR|nr:protein S100-A16 isoform X2 [Tursiops truncatus]